jgi:Protein of unknown function (DUF2924)
MIPGGQVQDASQGIVGAPSALSIPSPFPSVSLDFLPPTERECDANRRTRMNDGISAKLAELPHFKTSQLRALWLKLFAKPVHPKLRRDLMIPILAYRIQEKAYGGLKPSTRKRLQRLAGELERDPKAQLQPNRQLKTGTKLIRQWQGETHEVLVVDRGLDYRNKRYKSLSEIARQITGTRWSGPLFFGLKQPRNERPSS